MLSSAAAWVGWFQAVLDGMATPAVIAVVLALTTLLLEDLAIAVGVALATQGVISWELSIAAVGLGIALGDLGLYALGMGARRLAWLRRRYVGERSALARRLIEERLASAVLIARVVPGLRLAVYTASGFVRVPVLAFTAWVVLAVSMWTVGLYALSAAVGQALALQFGLPAPMAVALPILVLALAIPLVRVVRRCFGSPSR